MKIRELTGFFRSFSYIFLCNSLINQRDFPVFSRKIVNRGKFLPFIKELHRKYKKHERKNPLSSRFFRSNFFLLQGNSFHLLRKYIKTYGKWAEKSGYLAFFSLSSGTGARALMGERKKTLTNRILPLILLMFYYIFP